MIDDIQEVVETLKELKDYFDPNEVGGLSPEKELTTDRIIAAREAIEKLRDVRSQMSGWLEALKGSDLDGIEKLLSAKAIEHFAEFDRDAAYEEKFHEIDVGDEEKLAGQQDIAMNASEEEFQSRFHKAEAELKSLSEKLSKCVDSLEAQL